MGDYVPENSSSFLRKQESSDFMLAEAKTLDSRLRGNDEQKHKPARVRLGDITDSCLGKMLDKEKNRGIYQPYLANLNVRWGGFELSNLHEMRFEPDEEERYGLKFGDLVVCEGGEPGRCAIWREQRQDMKFQKALHRLRVKEGYSVEYLFYRMLLAGRTGELAKHFIGSTIKHLTGIGLAQVEFEFPEFAEQQKIAAVLSALDAKIDLNHRINAELEALAKTIYDYWFVQFDFPDAHGRPYKSSGGAMVWNDTLKREIPAGWNAGSMDDLGQIVGGSTPSKSHSEYFGHGMVPWITPKDLSNNKGNKFIARGETDVSEAGMRSASLTLYPAGTVLMSSRAPVGYLAIALNPMATNQGFKSFIPSKGYGTAFVYYAVERALPVIIQYASGSTFVEISGSVLKSVNAVLPDKSITDTFCRRIEPITEHQRQVELENVELTHLRDWLLPLLMNGQVRVA